MTDPAEVREDIDSPLVDLSGLTLEDVAQLPDSVLGAALRRIMDAAARPDPVFAGEYQQILTRY